MRSFLTFSGGWVVGVEWGGVVGEVRYKAISTRVVVEVGVELGYICS